MQVRSFAAVDRVIDWLCRLSLYAGAAASLGILALLVGSSFKRYVLGTPIPVTEELAGLLFVATSFCSVPYGLMSGRQIRLQILSARLPKALSTWASVVGDLLGAAVIGLIVVQLVAFAEYSRGAGARTDVSGLLLWPWMMLMPVMLGLVALAMVLRAAQRAHAALAGRFEPPASDAQVD